ncbi:metallophosphoesterase [Candidatus Dojkabacteria bacterium]|jgi:predicted phosphodiesterase|nr:metallophosphoesterase [Candidatus Dojkabacteria bacterium]
MKIAYASDLHLEFGDIDLKNTEDCDVLVIAGDLLIAQYLHENPHTDNPIPEKDWSLKMGLAYRFRGFLDRISKEFKEVVIIAGNHCFYHGYWYKSLDHLREEYSKFSNIHFLENESIVLDDVTFIGTTLWTDMNKSDPITIYSIKYAMNDFSLIKNDNQKYRKLSPEDTVVRHRTALDYISNIVRDNQGKKIVVVGHHSPSQLSVHPKYKDDYEMNGGYASSLTQFIFDRPEIKVWFHGHTHEPFDYMLGRTRIACNPRGYAEREESAKNFKLKCVEV